MKRRGTGGIAAGIILMALGLIGFLVPLVSDADMMAWGYGVMAVSVFVFIVGGVTLLLYRHRSKVLNRMADNAEILARWTYSEQEWNEWREQELAENKGMPVFGGILGGIFLLIGIVFYASDPDDMGLMFAIMAGVGLVIALSAVLAARARSRAIQKDPGEAVIARGGVWFMGNLTDWNGVTSWFDHAKIENDDGKLALVVHYSYIAGRYARRREGQVSVPVPRGKEAEAETAVLALNRNPNLS